MIYINYYKTTHTDLQIDAVFRLFLHFLKNAGSKKLQAANKSVKCAQKNYINKYKQQE